MNDRWTQVLNDLETLRQLDAALSLSCADHHKYIVNPPLTEAEVIQFEAQHRIRLPTDYREFLLRIGNGGVGPSYGVFKLGESDMESFPETPGSIGELSEPFPYVEAWNYDPPAETQSVEETYQHQDYYWGPVHVTGTILICDHGCNMFELLVVTGPERGHLWQDCRADWAGLVPSTSPHQSRITFFEWYRSWLDSQLAMMHTVQRLLNEYLKPTLDSLGFLEDPDRIYRKRSQSQDICCVVELMVSHYVYNAKIGFCSPTIIGWVESSDTDLRAMTSCMWYGIYFDLAELLGHTHHKGWRIQEESELQQFGELLRANFNRHLPKLVGELMDFEGWIDYFRQGLGDKLAGRPRNALTMLGYSLLANDSSTLQQIQSVLELHAQQESLNRDEWHLEKQRSLVFERFGV